MLSFISRHKIFSTCAAALVLIFICAAGATFYDAPILDDSDLLLPTPPAVAKEDNAAVLLSKLSDKIKTEWDDMPKSLKDMSSERRANARHGASLNPEWRNAFLRNNEEAITLLLKAIDRPYIDYQPVAPNDLTYDTDSLGNPNEYYHIEALYCLRWYDMPENFLTDMTRWLEFCRRYSIGPHSRMEEFIAGASLERNSLQHISNCARFMTSTSLCRDVIAHLQNSKLSQEDMVNAIRRSYTLFDVRSWLSHIRSYPGDYKFAPSRYWFKENSTKRFLHDIAISSIECVKSNQPDIGRDISTWVESHIDFSCCSSGWRENPVYAKYMPNIQGARMTAIFALHTANLYDQYIRLNTQRSVTLCTLALRTYWLDHGTLPDSLEKLVPTYLPSIPIDFSCNKPVQYNKSVPAVYTGEDTKNGMQLLDPEYDPFGSKSFSVLDWAKSE